MEKLYFSIILSSFQGAGCVMEVIHLTFYVHEGCSIIELSSHFTKINVMRNEFIMMERRLPSLFFQKM